ncbi:phage tail protein [Fervidibacillus albus]|uniref:Phage tail tape measure protein n=1 Tax=Fervidibacillus albus TaxID=2980026 RepID=A0A9E8RV59_9BACI|nr:hypothetical protein [Fervidibacillus albus]WAA10335.1 hypothetical protein OE104_03095 [Fervidibacillus albus]
MEIFRLFGSIFIDNSDADKKIGNTEKKAESLAKKFGDGIKTVAKWGAAIGGASIAAGGAMMGVATKAASATDRIDKMSQKLGMSRQAFQQWDFILSQNGVNIESLSSGMKTLTNQVDDLARGGSIATEAFGALGLSYNDLKGLSREQIFEKTIVALQGIEDEAKRAAIANDLLGRTGQELAPLLNAGAESVEELKQKAHELGLVLDDDAIDAGVKFTDTMDQLKRSFENVISQVGVGVMPIIQKFADWIIANMPIIQAIIQNVFKAFEFIVNSVVSIIQMLLLWFNALFEGNKQTFEGMSEKIKEVFTFIYDYWISVWEGIKAFWEENGQAILQNASIVFLLILETVETAFNAVKEIIVQVVNFVSPWIQEKLEQIKQFWAENGEQIMQAVQNAFQFIQSVIEFVMPFILAIITQVWNNIQGVIDGSLNVIMGIIKVFSGLFTGDFSKLWEGIKQIFSGALEFIWNFIQLSLIGRVMGVVRKFGSLFKSAMSQPFTWIRNFINKILSSITSRAKSFASGFVGAFKFIPNGMKSILNGIVSAFNKLIRGLNRFKVNIPKWVPGLGGKSFGISIPTIPALAEGGNIVRCGRVLVGEAGPEILDLPKGAKVTPLNHPSLQEKRAQPLIIQLMATNNRELARWLIDDINELLARR